MAISATMVKELRDKTGAGMMDCKSALTETGGDMEAAVDWLRTKGLAKAAKKAGRTAAEGLVAVAVRGGVGVAVELNSETDFVAKNAEFQGLVGAIATAALDVTDLASIKAAIAHAETEVGPIDILINNSGVSTTQRLQDVSEADYDFIFDTNTKGAFFVAQEVAKRMLARAKGAAPGTFVGGRIINIASMAGLKVLPQIGVYCMSKAAVVQMTKAMAVEWGKFGINVNAICPGYIDTEINHHHW